MLIQDIHINIMIVFYSCYFLNNRIGSYKLNYMVVQTLLSTMLHWMPRRLLTGAQCLLFNSILRPETLLFLPMALHCLMVYLYIQHKFIRMTHHLSRNGIQYRR